MKVLIKTIFEGDFVEEAKEGRKFHFEKREEKSGCCWSSGSHHYSLLVLFQYSLESNS